MTRASKSLLFSFLTLVLVFLLGWYTLHSTLFHRRLLSFLRGAIGWEITIKDSRLNLLRGRLAVDGLQAVDPTGRIRILADRVEADVSSLSLIRGKLIVTNLEIENPVVNLERLEPTAGPTPDFLTVLLPDLMNLIFQRFERSVLLQSTIFNRIHLRNFLLIRYGGKTIAFQKATFRIAPNLFRQIEVSAGLEAAVGMPLGVQSVVSDLALSRKGLTIKKVDVRWPKVHLSFAGEWKGGLEKGNLELQGELEVPTVLPEPVTFDVEGSVQEKTAVFKKIEGRLGQAVLVGKGNLHLVTRDYDISFKAENLPLESIFGKLPSSILGPAKGIGTVEGRFQGRLPELKAKAQASISDFRHGAMHARHAEGTLDFHWPELDFEADIKPGADGRTQGKAKGGVAFKHIPPFKNIKAALKTVDLSFENGSLQDILPTVKVSGRLKGELHLKGTPGSTSVEGPGHAEVTEGRWFLGPVERFVTDMTFKPGGRIVFTKTEFRTPAVEPILWPDALTLETGEGLVRYSGRPMAGLFVEGVYDTKTDVFKIDRLEYRRGGSNLVGKLTLRDKGGIEAGLKGSANLENLAFIPSFFREARGGADLDLSLTGTTQDPLLRGWIDFRKNDLSLRGFPTIEEIEGRLTFDGPIVRPNLTGLLGDGRFRLGGSLGLKRFRPESFDLTLKGANLSYYRPNAYRIDVDADVRLKGTLPAPKLSGRIDIVDALYRKPFRLREFVLKPFEEEPAEESSWRKTLDPWELDLVVKHSGDLRIKNNIADVYLLADLHIGGTYARPRIGGAFTSTEGELRLFGEEFLVTEGRLEFIDPARREPYLTLRAEQDIPPLYTVFVELKGYLSNLEVNLTSTPGLPREDVISLIATGHTQEELRQSGVSSRSLGMGVLAGEISGAVSDPIAKSTGLDIFRLEASESGQLSKVALGKEVTDRLTIEFQSDFAPETAQRMFQANYYLTDNILLKGRRVWVTGQSNTAPPYNLNMSFRLRMY